MYEIKFFALTVALYASYDDDDFEMWWISDTQIENENLIPIMQLSANYSPKNGKFMIANFIGKSRIRCKI